MLSPRKKCRSTFGAALIVANGATYRVVCRQRSVDMESCPVAFRLTVLHDSHRPFSSCEHCGQSTWNKSSPYVHKGKDKGVTTDELVAVRPEIHSLRQ
jgi:hypothetical protein